MFSKLFKFFSDNKKNILWTIVFISLFFILSDSAFAADAAAKTSEQNLAEYKQTASSFMKWVWTTISVFLALLTYLGTVFLSPEWINGSLFWLNEYFKSIWVLVSNVVYLIFAFILIWIAFMNIIWKWQEKYALKQALPKFIVGILIVPFSWFIIQFILSLSAILTISALNLPFETFDKFNTSLSSTKIPKSCTLNLKTLGESKEWDSKEESKKFFDCWKEWDNQITLEEIRKSEDGIDSIFWIMWLYTYWILSIESMDKLNDFDISSIKNMSDLVVKLLFDVLFIIVYSVLIIAIWLVLMVRWIYIWIYIMISPLFGLMYFFDKTSWWWEFFDKFNLKQFISLAFVPVYTMLALSFWLLFIYAAWNGMSYDSEFKDVSTVKLDKPTWEWDQKLSVGQFNLTIKWSPANPNNITWFFNKVADWWMWIIGTLIMKIFGIVVLWWAVMAALRSNEITKAIVEPLHSFGTQVWGLVTKAPQYAPIFGGQSMKSMQTIASWVEWKVSQNSTDRANKFLDKTPFGNNQITKSNQNLQSEIMVAQSKPQQASLMQKILKNANWDEKNLYTNAESQKALFNLVNKINPKILEELSIKKSTDIDSIDKIAKIYEKVESEWLPYKGILQENEWQINGPAIIKEVKRLKDQQITTPAWWSQERVSIEISQNFMMKWADWKTNYDIGSISNQLFNQEHNWIYNKEEFKKLLIWKWIVESEAEKIIEELDKKDAKFFKTETPKTK